MKVVKLNGKLLTTNDKILGANAQEKTVTPTSERQVITADSGYSCLSKVIVEGVTASMEISTEAEMDALLIADNIGKIYKFVGTSSKYITNAIYIVEEN